MVSCARAKLDVLKLRGCGFVVICVLLVPGLDPQDQRSGFGVVSFFDSCSCAVRFGICFGWVGLRVGLSFVI